MHAHPLHFGILRTDAVLETLQPEFGDYPVMFRRVFGQLDVPVTFTDIDAQGALPASVDCDAYIITGSRHSVYEELSWLPPLVDFLRQVLREGKKIVGVCFGHQLMAHFFGGRVEQAAQGWGVGVHACQVMGQPPWMGERAAQLALLCSHRDQVQQLPETAELWLSSSFCPLSGFTMGDQVITVQGHPEFSKPYAQALMDMRREMLGEEVYRRGVDSLEQTTDEVRLAGWLLDFVATPRGN